MMFTFEDLNKIYNKQFYIL